MEQQTENRLYCNNTEHTGQQLISICYDRNCENPDKLLCWKCVLIDQKHQQCKSLINVQSFPEKYNLQLHQKEGCIFQQIEDYVNQKINFDEIINQLYLKYDEILNQITQKIQELKKQNRLLVEKKQVQYIQNIKKIDQILKQFSNIYDIQQNFSKFENNEIDLKQFNNFIIERQKFNQDNIDSDQQLKDCIQQIEQYYKPKFQQEKNLQYNLDNIIQSIYANDIQIAQIDPLIKKFDKVENAYALQNYSYQTDYSKQDQVAKFEYNQNIQQALNFMIKLKRVNQTTSFVIKYYSTQQDSYANMKFDLNSESHPRFIQKGTKNTKELFKNGQVFKVSIFPSQQVFSISNFEDPSQQTPQVEYILDPNSFMQHHYRNQFKFSIEITETAITGDNQPQFDQNVQFQLV